MADIVYIFGAGINRDVKDWEGFSPPLATDFFQQTLRHGKFGDPHFFQILEPVFDYISQYWKHSKDDLKLVPFDLEACFTLLELQLEEVLAKGNREQILSLIEIHKRLTAFLAEYLNEFEVFAHSSELFLRLGKILYSEKPTIISFNYDTIIEAAIEMASGVNSNLPDTFLGHPRQDEVPDGELPYSHFTWNRTLSYGVKFDEVQLQRAGVSTFVSGDRFYSHKDNKLFSPPLLKLHGSLNWFVYTGIIKYPVFETNSKADQKKGKTVLYRGHWWLNEAPDLNNIILHPIILTPVINKQIQGNAIIQPLWEQAKYHLSTCKRLVVGGYSFPPTDFQTRRLFLEAFKNHTPEELIIINPDTSLVQLVKDLCHFKKPVLACKNLDEFIALYGGSVL